VFVVEDDIKGKVFKLKDIVGFQEESIVSRTIIDRPEGTVTLFAFDEGQALSEHSAPYNALVTVVEGKLEVKLGGKPNEVNAGESIIMPAGVPHALRALSQAKMLLVMVRGS
jgi:quercetin dioxygenase-like cupin family protein